MLAGRAQRVADERRADEAGADAVAVARDELGEPPARRLPLLRRRAAAPNTSASAYAVCESLASGRSGCTYSRGERGADLGGERAGSAPRRRPGRAARRVREHLGRAGEVGGRDEVRVGAAERRPVGRRGRVEPVRQLEAARPTAAPGRRAARRASTQARMLSYWSLEQLPRRRSAGRAPTARSRPRRPSRRRRAAQSCGCRAGAPAATSGTTTGTLPFACRCSAARSASHEVRKPAQS